jgi:hypothetical protein
MKLPVLALIAMIALLLLAVPAGATISYYASQSEWAAATSGVFTINFDDVINPNPPGFVDYSFSGLKLHDVTFTDTAHDEGQLIVATGYGADSFGFSFAGNYLRGNTWGDKSIIVTLPGNVYALSMVVLTGGIGGPIQAGTVTFSFPAAESFPISIGADATPDFIGFISDQPIGSLTIGSTENATALDNFSFGQTTVDPAPEANTLLLGGIGMALLLVVRRLRRFR